MRVAERARLHHYLARPHLIRDIVLLGIAASMLTFLTAQKTLETGSWNWFQRAGAPYAVLGTILLGRSNYRQVLRRHQLAEDPETELDELSTRELLQRRADRMMSLVGLVLSAVGSLMWAYGDLLPAQYIRGLQRFFHH